MLNSILLLLLLLFYDVEPPKRVAGSTSGGWLLLLKDTELMMMMGTYMFGQVALSSLEPILPLFLKYDSIKPIGNYLLYG